MAEMVENVWGDCLLPRREDPAWTAELTAAFGVAPKLYALLAPSPWLRSAALAASRVPYREAPQRLLGLAHLITSQENACRYCYGTARANLRLMGFPEDMLDALERDAQRAGADEVERTVLQFCRRLARSNPRPAGEQRRALEALGLTPAAVVEIAYGVAMSCFGNRVATFVAVPPEVEFEALPDSWFTKLFGKLALRKLKHPSPLPEVAPKVGGQFWALVRTLEGTGTAGHLQTILESAFASDVLPTRAKLLVFAVVAHSLGCNLCAREAGRALEGHGISPADLDGLLATLTSPRLDALEARLVPWARETVHYVPAVIQKRTRELRAHIGDDALLEAVGIAGLANGCARLGMLGDTCD